MTVTELIENMKTIVDGYDSSFAKRMEELPKEAKTERKALLIQRGMCNVVKAACLLAYANNSTLPLHKSRLSYMSVSEKDQQTLSALSKNDKDTATAYLATIHFAKAYFLIPYKNELAVAENSDDNDMIFELRIKVKTFDIILTSLRDWWSEHGCAEFEV